MVTKRLGCKWSGYGMRSEFRKPNHLKSEQKCPVFWMVWDQSNSKSCAQPFENWTIFKSDLQKVRISNVSRFWMAGFEIPIVIWWAPKTKTTYLIVPGRWFRCGRSSSSRSCQSSRGNSCRADGVAAKGRRADDVTANCGSPDSVTAESPQRGGSCQQKQRAAR